MGHVMESRSALMALWEEKQPAVGGFPSQRTNDTERWCLFVISLNKLLNKQSLDCDLGRHDDHMTSL